ncbi:MAG: hypothetical protein R3362_02520, partial [Rhodothermales bacterium]|nr:hypothetical protein [Rhodothermales bacterium]
MYRAPLGPLLLFLLLTGPAAQAQIVIDFPDFADLSGFTLNGSTGDIANPVFFEGQDVLRLTDGLGQSGSAFLTEPVPLVDEGGFRASFSTFFAFQITDPVGAFDSDGVQGADGLVFVVQTVSDEAGGAGGGIGYQGIESSLGVEFDTWNNAGQDGNDGNHVGIDLDGDVASVAPAPVSPPFNTGAVWYAWVDYDGDTQVLEVRVSEASDRPAAPLLTLEVDLPDVLGQEDAFVGFTSGTGAAGGDHDVRTWTFTNEFAPVANAATAPEAFALEPVYPNPFRPAAGPARIVFHVAHPQSVRIAVYDVLGREVSVLSDR